MILWHLGVGAALVYVTLGRRRIDYRYILIGAVLPDLVDGVARHFLDYEGSGRGLAHSLVSFMVLAVLVVVLFKGETRLAVFGLPVGWLTHIFLDGMWQAPKTFLWPAFGSGFDALPAEPYAWDLVTDPTAHLLTWSAEVVGLLVLAWFWVAHRLGEDGRLRLFLSDGYLRP